MMRTIHVRQCFSTTRNTRNVATVAPASSQNHTSTITTHVPIVDMSLPVDDMGRVLHDACTRVGFFYLVNHGVSEDLRRRLLQEARAFFSMTIEEKERISVAHSNSYRGYQWMGVNITRQKQDGHEALDLVSESTRANIVRDRGLANYGSNQWPDPTMLPQFQSTVEEYVAQMNSVGLRLITAASLGLGLGPNYFAPFFTDPYWSMRLIRYPPLVPYDGIPDIGQDKNNSSSNAYEYGVGEHTDYGVFTMILCEDVKDTLQIRPKNNNNKRTTNDTSNDVHSERKDSEWIMVDPIPGGFICNLGDMLERWTNNMYVSTPHRVLRPSSSQGGDRISIPFFFDPNYDAYIAPVDHLVQQSGMPPCFEQPIMFGDHLLAKTSQNFRI